MCRFSDVRMKKKIGKYYDILTAEGSTEATLMLYGYIGEEYSWDAERGGYAQTGIRDIDFVREFEALEKQYPVIHLRIHSPGGEIWHGSAIVNSILKSTSEVHTWCDGICASMSAGIWAAGKKRHMAKNGMLMFHAGSNICWGNAKDMRETAEALDLFTRSIANGMAETLGRTPEEIGARYFDDYGDHWLDYSLAKTDGLLSDAADDNYTAAAQVPTNLASMTYHQLVASFTQEEKPAEPSLLKKAWSAVTAALIGSAPETITNITSNKDMTIQELKASLADGTLKAEDVQAALAELEPAENPAFTALTAKMAKMEATIAEQAQKLEAWGKAPGAARTEPGAPVADAPGAGDADTPQARLEAANARMLAAVEAGEGFRVATN